MADIDESRMFLAKYHLTSAARFSYGVLSLALLYLTVKYGGSFMYLAVFACMVEYQTYTERYETDMTPLSLQFPNGKLFLSLVNYILVGRLLRASGKEFIFCMRTQYVSLLLQLSGVVTIIVHPFNLLNLALSSPGSLPTGDVGNKLLGLSIRSTPFGTILWIVAFASDYDLWEVPELRKTFYCLFSSTGLLFINDVYNIFFLRSHHESYIATNEVPFIIFEILLSLICFTLFTAFHYGKVTPREFLRGYGKNAPLLGVTGLEYREIRQNLL